MKLGFLEILQLIFITLKLIGVITWSWWWVLSPLWIIILAIAFFFVLAILFGANITATNTRTGKKFRL